MEENTQVLDYIKKAFELKEQKQYKPAIEKLYKALETENDNIEILYQIGEMYFLMNDFTKSEKYLEKIFNINPNHISSLNLLRKIKQHENDYNSALETSQKLFELQQNCENLSELIKILAKLKLFEEIEKYKNSEFFTPDVKIECADALYSNGEIEKAIELLNQCNADNEKVLLLTGKIAFDNKDFETAQQIFSRISQNTQNPEILNFMGLFETDNMNFVEAIKYFSQASNLNKSNSKYIFNLGNAYFFNGWYDEAQKAYSKAIYINPENIGYRYALAYLFYDKKD